MAGFRVVQRGAVGCAQERLELENVASWECGRPVPSELAAGTDGGNEAGLMELDPAPGGTAAQAPPGTAAAGGRRHQRRPGPLLRCSQR